MRKIFSMIGQTGHVSRGLPAPLRRPQQDIRHGVEVPAAARPPGGRHGLQGPRQQARAQGGGRRHAVAGAGHQPPLPRDEGPPPGTPRVTCHVSHVSTLHLQHYTEILGGMWGARLDTGHRELLREAMAKLIRSVRKREHFRTAFTSCLFRPRTRVGRKVWTRSC